MVLAGLLWATRATAALLQISPLGATVEAEPGQPFEFTIRLTNGATDAPAAVELSLADIQQHADRPVSYPPAGSTPWSCASWLALPESVVTIQAQATRTLTVKGRLPATPLGSAHAVIRIRPLTANVAVSGSRLGLDVAYAFPVDVLVVKQGTPALLVADLRLVRAPEIAGPLVPEVTRPWYADKVAARLTLTNRGDRLAALHGLLVLRDMRGGRILQQTELGGQRGWRVLPGCSSVEEFVFHRPAAVGRWQVELQGSYGQPPRELTARAAFDLAATDIVPAGGLVGESERYRIQIQPGQLAMAALAGQETVRRLVVRNLEAVDLVCEATAAPYAEAADGTPVQEASPPGAPTLAVAPVRATVPRRGGAGLQVTLAGGDGASGEREQYWRVRVVGRPAGAPADSQEVAIGRALVVVADPAKVRPAELQVAEVAVDRGAGQTGLQLLVRNAGGTACRVVGLLRVKDLTTGQAVATCPIGGEATAVTVLAGSARRVAVKVPAALASQPWACELVLNLGVGRSQTVAFTVDPGQAPAPAGE